MFSLSLSCLTCSFSRRVLLYLVVAFLSCRGFRVCVRVCVCVCVVWLRVFFSAVWLVAKQKTKWMSCTTLRRRALRRRAFNRSPFIFLLRLKIAIPTSFHTMKPRLALSFFFALSCLFLFVLSCLVLFVLSCLALPFLGLYRMVWYRLALPRLALPHLVLFLHQYLPPVKRKGKSGWIGSLRCIHSQRQWPRRCDLHAFRRNAGLFCLIDPFPSF